MTLRQHTPDAQPPPAHAPGEPPPPVNTPGEPPPHGQAPTVLWSWTRLSPRDAELRELMDDPECDPERLRRTLSRFAVVNRLVSGWGHAYRRHVRPALPPTPGPSPVRILDIGCGGGDVLRRVVHLARADGHAVEALGIDPDERALRVALSAPSMPGVSFRRARSEDLAAEGERFDVVISNHVLHHLDDGDRAAVFADSERLARRVVVHSDIGRSRVAYAAYAVGITPFAPGSFLRTDGLRSIRRSYTREELTDVVPAGWSVERGMFRVLAVHRPRRGSA